MSVPATAVWEVQAGATANNANGAGFDPGNANMATDLAIDSGTENTATPVVSSASYNFVAGDVNNWLYVKSGTNWNPGWYLITAVDGTTHKATLSAGAGAAIITDATLGYPTPKYKTNTTVGVAASGTTSGGTWTIDYSQKTAANIAAVTNLASANGNNATPTVTSSGNSFGKNHVGNVIHITAAGTNFTVGWYFISSVDGSGGAVLDRACGTSATCSGGTYSLGGAASLNSSTSNQTDSNLLNSAVVGSNTIFAQGALTLAGGVNISLANGAITAPTAWIGYVTNRATAPTGTNRPSVACGSLNFTTGNYGQVYHTIFTGSGSIVLQLGNSSGCFAVNCKAVCTSTSSTASAINVRTQNAAFNCEAVCYRGRAFDNVNVGHIFNCYAHDSDIGIRVTGGAVALVGSIIESCVSKAVDFTVGNGNSSILSGNTLYGSENKTGIGLGLTISATSTFLVVNNVFYGFTTAVSQGTSSRQNSCFADYNDYNNNTADLSNWAYGAHDVTTAPQFTSVSQITGTAGKFRAGNDALIDTTKDFSALGVIAGQDKVYIKTGSGVTAGIYGISSIATTTNPNDTLVLDIAPGTNTTADKAYQITIGHNFAIGANLKALGFPGAFPASLSTGYEDIGAVQRREAGGLPMAVAGMM